MQIKHLLGALKLLKAGLEFCKTESNIISSTSCFNICHSGQAYPNADPIAKFGVIGVKISIIKSCLGKRVLSGIIRDSSI